MDSPVDFADLMRQVRAGDAEAAAKLIQHYDAELRIIARVRLNDPGLRRVMDSMDICQSVLANFFVRVSHGQFELDSPEQLLKLLASMIRNKVTDHARRQKADRRDFRRTAGADAYEVDVAGSQETPSQIMSAKELAQACHERFTSDERDLIEQRPRIPALADVNRAGPTNLDPLNHASDGNSIGALFQAVVDGLFLRLYLATRIEMVRSPQRRASRLSPRKSLTKVHSQWACLAARRG